MVDIVDTKTRSRMMSAIRGKDTKPEVALRRALHARGLRFRLHSKDLPGKPDLVFPKFKAVIFVHGCFWHRHEGCRFATSPATRSEFWQKKFEGNVLRDQTTCQLLMQSGWRVAVVWECTLKSLGADNVATELQDWLERTFQCQGDITGIGTGSPSGTKS